MFNCDICEKEFSTPQGTGVHRSYHTNPGCSRPMVPFEELKKDGSRKTRLIVERGHTCEICKLTKWMNQPIPIELDHIDGNPDNNGRENLRLLCPNCHSQTPTHAGRNTGKHSGTARQTLMARYPSYRKRSKKGS
jgi:5-methylcytosine-specific restriction endonuclease McrA